MSKKPFDYSKWDNIEISDDEEDCHPNIDKESWFRMKHRSRVEREDNESKDKAVIHKQMEEANKRIQALEKELEKLNMQQSSKNKKKDDDDSDDDDDLDESEGIRAEIAELRKANAARQAKLDQYEKNKKWNVDNMFQVKEERTIINPTAGQANYTPTGFAKPRLDVDSDNSKKAPPMAASTSNKPAATATSTSTSSKPVASSKPAVGPMPPPKPHNMAKLTDVEAQEAADALISASATVSVGEQRTYVTSSMDTYHEFTEKYADLIEEFMHLPPDLEVSKNFLLKHGEILLQENASNYLLLASLEDEMNGYHEKMKFTTRQSQLITNIAELAKTVNTHPGNVIMPFFARLREREHLEEFLKGVKDFQEKIVSRAVVKKAEIDEQRRREEQEQQQQSPTSLEEIPLEQRLGPGGLDPLEVIETLPEVMVKAFESRDVDQLKLALETMDPSEAEYHMKRCIDSGLWVANANNA